MANVQTPPQRIYPSAPHPTPIATAKGKRTAVVDDEMFSDYLSKHLSVPDLSLPKIRRPRPTPHLSRRNLSAVDLLSLSSSHHIEDVARIIRAAIAGVGAFQIVNHGLSPDLIGLARAMDQEFHRNSLGLCHNSGLPERCSGHTEENRYRYQLRRRKIGAETERIPLSDKMESVYLELEKIARALSLVFKKIYTGRRHEKRMTEIEPVLWLRRYKNQCVDEEEEEEENPHEDQNQNYAFTLHLILGSSELHFPSHNGVDSFSTKPGSLVVTAGNQLQEWIEGELIRTSIGEPFVYPGTDGSPCLSLELVWSLSSLSQEPARLSTTISIFDQILFVLAIALAYDLLKIYLQKP
ncbi:uncharacterized protein [Aristolochia californica]|uniref:uncharacterized protein n=1 Tax=Aristolochia californica TaxID=171875 RepID=UPI0035DAD4C3